MVLRGKLVEVYTGIQTASVTGSRICQHCPHGSGFKNDERKSERVMEACFKVSRDY